MTVNDTQPMKEAIVTGAYGAIGAAIATGIAATPGWRVTLAGRDPVRLEEARRRISRTTGNPEVQVRPVDLGLHREIKAFARSWDRPLFLLVNNAATAPKKRTETEEGIEVQWATNVLGYFWMMRYFHPFMAGQDSPRIVNVASYWAGGLDLADPEFTSRRYDNDTAYRQAKQADRMLSSAFAGRLQALGISVNSCHPGDVNSKLSNAFGFGGCESPEEGAATPLLLALSSAMTGVTGRYYEHLKPVRCAFSEDRQEVERLFLCCDGFFPEK